MRLTREVLSLPAAALPLVAFLFQAGCLSGENRPSFYTYCDHTGCYQCDQRGCGLLEGRPPGAACTKASDCAAGCFCGADGKCAEAGFCDRTEDCARGYTCNVARHSCEPTAPGQGGVVPKGCKVGLDCGAGGECVDGTCKRAPVAPNACVFNRQCGQGGVCIDGRCEKSCTDDAGCGTGRSCQAGRCQIRPAPVGGCVNNNQCGAGQVCISSTCHPSCTKDGDCQARNAKDICVEGICRPDERRVPECSKNADCRAGTECVDATCRTFCFAGSDCAACADGPVCSGGYCMTAREANPQCRLPGDCGGLHCIDGACAR